MENMSILYIDDENENLVLLKYLFMDNFEVRTADTYEKAVELLSKYDDIKIILSDQRMPGKQGIEILEEFYQKYPDKIRILITAYSDIEVITEAVNRAKIFHYISKPIDINNFRMVIQNAINLIAEKENSAKLSSELTASNSKFKSIIENSLDIIFQLDSEGNTVYFNQVAADNLKIDNDAAGKSFKSLAIDSNLADFTESTIETVNKNNRVVRSEFAAEKRVWDVLCIPEYNEKNIIDSYLFSARDITELKRYEREIQMKEKI